MMNTSSSINVSNNNNKITSLIGHADHRDKMREMRECLLQDSEVTELKDGVLEDEFLLKFLRARTFDVKRAVHSIKLYLNARKTHPEIFTPASKLGPAFASGIVGVLPDKNLDSGETILITRPGCWDPDSLPFDQYTAATAISLEVAAMEEQTQKNGLINIIDMTGFGWKHLKNYGPAQAKRTADVTEKIMPLKFKEIHVINESYLARAAYALLKSFLSDEFNQKIHFHGSDLKKLHKIVSPEILPAEIGGTRGPFDACKWFDKLVATEPSLTSYWRKCTIDA